MAKAKAIFSDEVSEEIDDLLPSELPPPPAETEEVEEHGTPAPPPPKSVTTVPRRRRDPVSAPSVQVEPTLAKALRKLTTKEKGQNPITARTYAQVVLDAIEANQTELSVRWPSAPARDNLVNGLFSRPKERPSRRRRHPQPPARVPLYGITPDNLEVLDKLVADWNASSRSALVEEALRLYFAKLAPKPSSQGSRRPESKRRGGAEIPG